MLLLGLFLLTAQNLVEALTTLQPLGCNSVNTIPESAAVDFIYISPSTRDCIFLFEGPSNSNLDMKLLSLTNANTMSWDDLCTNSTLRMYNYMKDNRVELDQTICSEASLITETNMGVVTSSLNDGSFVLEVRSLDKRSPFYPDIFGMDPPVNGARDFFSSDQFVPSPGPQSGWSPYRAVPIKPTNNQFKPSVAAPYPGRPTALVDLTYNNTGLAHHTVVNADTNVPNSKANATSIHHHSQQESSTNSNSTSAVASASMKGPSTHVEINISNGTDTTDSKGFQ